MSDPTPTPTPTLVTSKLKREAHLFYIDTSFDVSSDSPSWYRVGKDVEDMSIELNPDTETIKNILGEVHVRDNGYEPSISVDTYYAEPGTASTPERAFYEKIKDIAMNRKTGDDCRTTVLEVVMDMSGEPFFAWTEEAIIKPQSYGGPQGGISIPYNVSFDGNRKQGTVTYTGKVPTFTAAT